MRILVCGDRNWTDTRFVWSVLDKLFEQYRGHEEFVLIEGAARGADRAAGEWAESRKKHGVEHLRFPADWARYGRRAGPIRNQAMLDAKPDLVVAFHNSISNSKGTADMLRRAESAGVETLLVGNPEKVFDG